MHSQAPPQAPDVPPTAIAFLRATGGFYAAMLVVGLVWLRLRGASFESLAVSPEGPSVGLAVLAGLGVGLATVLIGDWMQARFAFAQALSRELSALIPPLTWPQALLAAGASAAGEEVLFRGAMQQSLGLWPTVLLFGVVHGMFERRLLVWMVFATLMGAIFGGLVVAFGSLLAPAVAHFTINAINLRALGRRRAELHA